MQRIVIVGGGISGLSLAWRLSRAPDCDVTVLDAGAQAGGCIRTVHKDGFTIECGPNGFLDSNPATLQLARDAGLGDQLITASESSSRKRYLFLGDRLHALPTGICRLLRSPLLSLRGKLALLSEPLRPRRKDSGPESVAAFARRRAGREAAEVFADAMVTGIHGGDPELLDVRAAFPRLVRFEREAGSVVNGFRLSAKRKKSGRAKLWSFRSGLGTLVDGLRDSLPRAPVLGVAVRRIERADNGWTVHGDGRDSWPADAVVLTCPAYEQARILADLDPVLAESLASIAYNRIAVVALGFREADVPNTFDGFGYIAPQRLRRDLLGVQWCSAIYPERAPPGCVLWRALCGGWNRGEVVDWPDERLIAAVRAEIAIATGVLAVPIFSHIARWPRAIPQYTLGHPERVAAIEARAADYPGLFLAGNSLHGIALNDCAEQSERLLRRITSSFSR